MFVCAQRCQTENTSYVCEHRTAPRYYLGYMSALRLRIPIRGPWMIRHVCYKFHWHDIRVAHQSSQINDDHQLIAERPRWGIGSCGSHLSQPSLWSARIPSRRSTPRCDCDCTSDPPIELQQHLERTALPRPGRYYITSFPMTSSHLSLSMRQHRLSVTKCFLKCLGIVEMQLTWTLG